MMFLNKITSSTTTSSMRILRLLCCRGVLLRWSFLFSSIVVVTGWTSSQHSSQLLLSSSLHHSRHFAIGKKRPVINYHHHQYSARQQNMNLNAGVTSSGQPQPQQQFHSKMIGRNTETSNNNNNSQEKEEGRIATLADQYVVEIKADYNKETKKHRFLWSLFPIKQMMDGMGIVAEGEQAKQALFLVPTCSPSTGTTSINTTTATPTMIPSLVLECHSLGDGQLQVSSSTTTTSSVDTDDSVPAELQKLLLRIMAQWGALSLSSSMTTTNSMKWKVTIVGEGDNGNGDNDDDNKKENLVVSMDLSCNQGLGRLFETLLLDKERNNDQAIEWVEMVTGTGHILGRVPRRLVHTHNLLHRGIGLFVTKDKPLLPRLENNWQTDNNNNNNNHQLPDLYCHRRTDTKRIFPSLYDMFVGGVSLAGEDAQLTARREVAEELGLSRALLDEHPPQPKDDDSAPTSSNSAAIMTTTTGKLSDPLLDCVVCTGYNRCLVTLFSYTCQSHDEPITWQEEEVAWGDFIPYPVVAAAADRSIQRLVTKGTWPGAYPPIQSQWKGSLSSPSSQTSNQSKQHDWTQWDFVPDGLLVWEAWLTWLEERDLQQER